MRILLIHPHDVCSLQEPWTIRVLQLARSLRQLGHEAQVAYFPRTDEPRSRAAEWQGVPLVELDRRVGPWRLVQNTCRLWRLAAWAEVLHVQKAFHWAAVPVLVAGWLRGKPVHYDWDDWEERIYVASARPPAPLIPAWLRLLERWAPQSADTVSVSTDRLRQEAIARGVPPERIWWAPVGADPDQFHPEVSPERVRAQWELDGATVLYHGQLHGGQHAELVLRAAALVREELPVVRFLIVGDGFRRRELEAIARDSYLDCVTFVGAVPHEDIPAYIAAADVCVAAFEATEVTACKSPLKITEYLACGKPVVASEVGDVARMVGTAGVLVPPGEPERLAAAILQLLRDRPARIRLGHLARERATAQFTWRQTAQRLVEAYAVGLQARAIRPAAR